MKEIYLDNAATTKPYVQVVEYMSNVMLEHYGNPSSLHKKGMEAERIVRESSEFFSKLLGCTNEEIIFTSGGTESNNLAVLGAAYAYHRTGKKIITTAIEHPSVGEVFSYLEERGYEVVRMGVDEQGYINVDELVAHIDDTTILVSIMHVNNEIGTIQPLELIGKRIKEKNPKTLFHVDGVQAFAKIPITLKKCSIDYFSISAHKFHGPNGVGILYKSKNARLINVLHGGGQQKNIRSGTENIAGAAGMQKAAEIACTDLKEKQQKLMSLKQYLYEKLNQEIDHIEINGPKVEEGAPHILNISFEGVRSEVLLHALERFNIYVSSGSACSSNKMSKSDTLRAINKNQMVKEDAIRFSFNLENTKEEMDEVIDVLKKQLPILRKFTAGGKRK